MLDTQVLAASASAPVVAALNDKTVRLSGFLVTLEGDGRPCPSSSWSRRKDLASSSCVIEATLVEPRAP